MLELQDLKDFSITSWYKNFKDITLKTIILEVPDEFVERLKHKDNTDDSDENSDREEDDSQNQIFGPPEFIERLLNSLNSFEGEAFVKNNWHAPTDARMFSFGNTLKVSQVDDIILYFTTSGIIQEDFKVKDHSTCLALRKWISIHPAAEFRCIIINNTLRGITPRDWPTYYAHFKDDGPVIISTLTTFFKDHIRDKFPRSNYTFDVVLSYPERPLIMDFGPLNNKSNLYAFSWKEIGPLLNKDSSEELPPVFRYLESDIGIMTKASALQKIRQSST